MTRATPAALGAVVGHAAEHLARLARGEDARIVDPDRDARSYGEEGTFVFCTLWMVTALARSGQVERAKERFELVLGLRSDLGLMAEELDPWTGEQLGNFPQAFSHVGIISAALAIAEAEDRL